MLRPKKNRAGGKPPRPPKKQKKKQKKQKPKPKGKKPKTQGLEEPGEAKPHVAVAVVMRVPVTVRSPHEPR